MAEERGHGVSRRRGEFAALAVLSIAAGIILTLDNYDVLNGAWRFWPIFPLLLGVGAVLFFRIGRGTDLIPLGIGSYLILTSLFFFFLNFTSWSYMAKLWPAFIGFFGISVLIASGFTERKRWFALSGLFLTFLSITFFMVFTLNPALWPVSLVLFGIWVLLIPKGPREPGCKNQ